jgi:hypothetical protein
MRMLMALIVLISCAATVTACDVVVRSRFSHVAVEPFLIVAPAVDVMVAQLCTSKAAVLVERRVLLRPIVRERVRLRRSAIVVRQRTILR